MPAPEAATKDIAAKAEGFVEKLKAGLKTTKGKWIAFGAGSAVLLGAVVVKNRKSEIADDQSASR